MKHKLFGEGGFTLVELIVTATFVATMSTIIVEVFVTIGKVNRQARNLAVATELAQQKMEADRDAGYSAIPASEDFTASLPGYFGAPKSATATFSDIVPADSGLKQLDVSISYTDAHQTKNVKLSTLVAQTGIDR
jgi:type II secretory pathway pseudopilin PulG